MPALFYHKKKAVFIGSLFFVLTLLFFLVWYAKREPSQATETKFFKELEKNPPFCCKIAEIASSIESHDLEGALSKAVQFEGEWKEREALPKPHHTTRPGWILRVYNLIAIAELQRVLNHSLEEIQAWKDVESFSGWEEKEEEAELASSAILTDSKESSSSEDLEEDLAKEEAFSHIKRKFEEQGVDLQEYIALRKAQLNEF